MLFWAVAIHLTCIFIHVVIAKGSISCFGKPVDRNLLRLAIIVPPVLTLLVPGGMGDVFKGIVVWTLSYALCFRWPQHWRFESALAARNTQSVRSVLAHLSQCINVN